MGSCATGAGSRGAAAKAQDTAADDLTLPVLLIRHREDSALAGIGDALFPLQYSHPCPAFLIRNSSARLLSASVITTSLGFTIFTGASRSQGSSSSSQKSEKRCREYAPPPWSTKRYSLNPQSSRNLESPIQLRPSRSSAKTWATARAAFCTSRAASRSFLAWAIRTPT